MQDVVQIDFIVELAGKGTCCGIVDMLTHDVNIVTRSGGIKKTRVISIAKTEAALEAVRALNPSVEITCSEINY